MEPKTKLRFKIFFGIAPFDAPWLMADEQANNWIDEHPDVRIVEVKYQHGSYHGDHSICIIYRAKVQEDEDVH